MTQKLRIKQVGRNVAKYRSKAGLTQQQLADNVGISKSYLAKIEAPNSLKACSLDVLFSIADALKVDIRCLFDDIPGNT